MLQGRSPMPAAIFILAVLLLTVYAGAAVEEDRIKISCDRHGEAVMDNQRYLCAPADKPKSGQ
jgi:hypothetical protein